MNQKNKKIVIIIFVSILVLGFLFWFFLLKLNIFNFKKPDINNKIQLTNQQIFDILSATSNVPAKIFSEKEKKAILNKINKKMETKKLSKEEILQILNKENNN
ncbi:MAG: hypothetical protein V1910_02205 [bacterium]